jgi:hypothetical protein
MDKKLKETSVGVFDGHEVFTQEELDALSYVGESAGVGAVVGAGVAGLLSVPLAPFAVYGAGVACFFSLFLDD